MRRRLDELRGHFIVCAYGRVGRSIARELAAQGVPFVVVDSKAELEPDLDRDGQCYLIGDASDEAVLRQAGIERAQGLICAVDSDAENVFITIVARSLSPGLLIVARAERATMHAALTALQNGELKASDLPQLSGPGRPPPLLTRLPAW